MLQVEVEKSDMLVPSELDLSDYEEFLFVSILSRSSDVDPLGYAGVGT